jgi:hypothetical protein
MPAKYDKDVKAKAIRLVRMCKIGSIPQLKPRAQNRLGSRLAGDAVTVAQSAITGALGGCPDAGSRRAGRDHRRVRCRAGSWRAYRGPPDAAGVAGRFGSPDVCAAALRRLCGSGHRGLVATDMVAVMTATMRQHPAAGRYARLPDEGLAVGPELADPTGVLAAAFGDLASPLIVGGGVLRYYLRPAAAPPARGAIEPRVRAQRRLWHPAGGAAVPLLSHRRAGCRDRAPRYHRAPDPGRTTAPLRTTGIRTPPGPSPRRPGRRAPRLARPRRRPPSGHPRRVRRRPAHHRADLAPVPRLCQTASPTSAPPLPRPARGQDVGHALVDAALSWAYALATNGSRSISTPQTRCPGHSGSTPASARPDTAGASDRPRRAGLARRHRDLPAATKN